MLVCIYAGPLTDIFLSVSWMPAGPLSQSELFIIFSCALGQQLLLVIHMFYVVMGSKFHFITYFWLVVLGLITL